MRPPLSAIEPARRGVSRRMRWEAASAASRVTPCAGAAVGWPGSLRRRCRRRLRRRAGRRAWDGLGLFLRLLLRGLLLLLHLWDAEENLPSDQHDRREHDRKDHVFLVGHLTCSSRLGCRCGACDAARRLLSGLIAGGPVVAALPPALPPSDRRGAARRRAVRPEHSHGPTCSAGGRTARTRLFRRRRTRFRSTAVPTFLDTVKPTRIGPVSPRVRACNTKAAVVALTPLAAARKSDRCLNLSTGEPRAGASVSGAEPLAPAPASRVEDPAATLGRHAGAKSVTALAHQLARLIGPLHGFFSARRSVVPMGGWDGAGSLAKDPAFSPGRRA